MSDPEPVPVYNALTLVTKDGLMVSFFHEYTVVDGVYKKEAGQPVGDPTP